jgi:hypothetical protein
LIGVLTCAENTRKQVAQFIERVDTELAMRREGPRPPTA